MKKIAAILLILIYSMSTFGVSLKEFYCCGKLKSVSVVIADIQKNKCDNTSKEEGCCKTKYQYFKVKDNHLTTTYVTTALKHYTDLYSSLPIHKPALFNKTVTKIPSPSDAPPLRAVPVYLINCVFRI